MAIITQKHGTIEYLIADGISAPHCFTTRLGGVSTGRHASMNIGQSRGDDPANVAENFRILGQTIGFDPHKLVRTKQTHSDIVRRVDRQEWGLCMTPDGPKECDGLVTCDPGTALMVFAADCTPILLHDPVTGAVGACHAGWRGTAANIAGKTVAAMQTHFGCDPAHIRAAIGPNLGVCCFETDADVPQAMLSAFGPEVQQHIFPKGNKFYVNLKAINALALHRAGVTQVEISTECTKCQPDRFWSHRVHGDARGAQGAIIVCKEAAK